MEIPTLESVIRQYVYLPARSNGRGFFPVLCKVCGDHGKKGKRAGFKFDGPVVGYNCFNCGHTAVFDPSEHRSMPEKMKEVLSPFDIPEVDWQPVLFSTLNADGTRSKDAPTYTDIEPKTIEFPSYFYRLTDDPNDEWAQWAIEYLTEDRLIDWKSHPFYLVKKTTAPDNTRWYGRLIIPVYKDKKLIYWQGRDLTGLLQKKYLSPDVPRDKILGGFDQVFEYTDAPLYVTEGWFDSYWLNGVSVFGNKMTPEQVKWLSRSNRKKVIVPDRFGDGQLLAEQALELGWSISLPDIGEAKDVNDAVKKYGELYTLKTIRENTCDGFAAMAKLGIYCKPSDKKKKKKKETKL
jgi:hypothetical protein